MQHRSERIEKTNEDIGMTSPLIEQLRRKPVIPLIQADDPAVALKTAQALEAGGMELVEVVQRTDASLECLETIAREAPDLVVGAGTVLSAAEADDCIEAGARFLVSPGLDDAVVDAGQSSSIEVIPGIMTPTELQRAVNLGLTVVKFFPASASGGVPMLNALASVFRDISFIPTGGISASNLAEYLSVNAVLACGGSWMTPKSAIDAGDFDQVSAFAAEALTIAGNARRS